MKVKIKISIYDDGKEESFSNIDGEVDYSANSKNGISAINKSARKAVINSTSENKENKEKIKDMLITIADEAYMRMLNMR